MIQFNLLPDIKMEYIKAKRLKRLVILASIIVASVSLLISLSLATLNYFQKKEITKLGKDIDSSVKKLQDTPNIDRILTVQSQLKTLPELHGKKPAAKRLFNYLSDLTPTNVTIGNVQVDFVGSKMIIDGQADNLLAVNTFIDTLKFTKFSVKDQSESSQAFSGVLLAQFDGTESKALYSVTLAFDPSIFDNQQEIELSVPTQITTRSELARPNALFEKVPEPKKGER